MSTFLSVLFGLMIIGAGCSAGATPPATPEQKVESAAQVDSNVEVTTEPVVTSNTKPLAAPSGVPAKEVNKRVTLPAFRIFNVTGRNYGFNPAEIRVKKGDRVKLVFTSAEGFHDLKVEGYDVITSRVSEGNTTSIEFVAYKTGSFPYYCTVGSHRDHGMEGKLIVE